MSKQNSKAVHKFYEYVEKIMRPAWSKKESVSKSKIGMGKKIVKDLLNSKGKICRGVRGEIIEKLEKRGIENGSALYVFAMRRLGLWSGMSRSPSRDKKRKLNLEEPRAAKRAKKLKFEFESKISLLTKKQAQEVEKFARNKGFKVVTSPEI